VRVKVPKKKIQISRRW